MNIYYFCNQTQRQKEKTKTINRTLVKNKTKQRDLIAFFNDGINLLDDTFL